MKLFYVSTDNMGVNVGTIKAEGRVVETRDGPYVVFDLSGMDPVGNGQLSMSIAEARDVRDIIDKASPRLSSVPGSKK